MKGRKKAEKKVSFCVSVGVKELWSIHELCLQYACNPSGIVYVMSLIFHFFPRKKNLTVLEKASCSL